MHSHNYTPAQAWKRSFGEAKALAAVWSGGLEEINFSRTVLLGWMNDARRDLLYCLRNDRVNEWPHALRIRWQQRRAKLAGFREGWKTYRENSFETPEGRDGSSTFNSGSAAEDQLVAHGPVAAQPYRLIEQK